MLRTLLRPVRSCNFKPYSFPHHYIRISYARNIHFQDMSNNSQNALIVPLTKYYSTGTLRNYPKVKDLNNFDDNFKDLSSYYLNNGYVNADLFKKVINSFSEVKLSEEDENFLLESINWLHTLSIEERMKIFKMLWEYFKNNNNINQDKVIVALKVFQNNKITLNEARVYLNNFEDLKNDLILYEELIRLTCESGDIEKGAAEILEEMREKKLPLTNKVFSALILGHSRNKNIKNCEAVLDTMNAANLTPSTDTFFELLLAYIENGFEQKAEILFNKLTHDLSTNQILTLVRVAASVNSINITEKLTEKLPEELRNVTELPARLRGICIEFLYSDKIDSAFLILDSFPKRNFNENQDVDKFGQFFINEMIKSERYSNEKCLEICQKLIDSGKNERALHIACEIALRKYQEKAHYYLKALSNLEKLRPHYFWPLLYYNLKKRGEIGVLDTLKFMSSLSVQTDFETLNYHCFPRLSIIFKNIEEAAKSFERNGLKSTTFLTPLISHLIILQKINDVIKISNMYPTKIDTTLLLQPLVNLAINAKVNKRYQQYAKLIKVLIIKSESKHFDLGGQVLIELLSNSRFRKDSSGFFEILQHFDIQEIKISKSAVDLLQSQLSKQDDQNEKFPKTLEILKQMSNNELNLNFTDPSDSIITHPRDMSLKDLECHLVELEGKKLNTRGILRRLLQVYVRENQLEKALNIKEKCDKLNVHNSPGMLASILDLHIKRKNLDEAKKSLQDMKKKYPGFLIDEHKIIDLAALMVENNELEQAQNLILERTNTTRIIGGEYICRNLWNLLTQVAYYSARQHSDDTNNLTKEFFFMLKKYKFCQTQNVLLGPIIREYLLKNKIREAVQEFKFIADNFKKTPLQLEMMSILVKITNSNEELKVLNFSQEDAKAFLQDIITYTSNIHGPINCNGTLLLAVAESGNESQLRKLLINPEFQLNIETLSKNIEHLNSNGRIENILKLAKASRGMRHSLSEQDLYRMLLNEFVKKNNYESAINLFNKLEAEDDLKISGDFVKALVDLLKLNKKSIPSNIALRAQLKI